jgi:hypothetical protein
MNAYDEEISDEDDDIEIIEESSIFMSSFDENK